MSPAIKLLSGEHSPINFNPSAVREIVIPIINEKIIGRKPVQRNQFASKFYSIALPTLFYAVRAPSKLLYLQTKVFIAFYGGERNTLTLLALVAC
jgi:hypothetical protein